MANIEKTLQIFIPMVTSNVVQSNGITPYINFYIERLYMAHNINRFTKFAGLSTGSKLAKATLAIMSAIALGVKIYKDYWSGKKTRKDYGENVVYDVTNKLSEDLRYILDKPTQVVVGNSLINFVVMNFITDKGINEFRLKTDQTKNLFQRIVSRFFRESISIVTKDIFYCYSVEEVSQDDIIKKLKENPNNNVVIVDSVNDMVITYMKFKGAVTKQTVKLSKITNDKKTMGKEEIDIDRIIKSLKSVQVSKL